MRTAPAEPETPEGGADSIAARRARVVQLHPHLSQLELALELRVAPTTVARDERALGLCRNRGRPTGSRNGSTVKQLLHEQRATIRAEREANRDARVLREEDAYAAGAPLAQIAEAEGISEQQVWRDLKSHGVELHPPGRRNPFPGSIEERRTAVAEAMAACGSTSGAARKLDLGQSLVYNDYVQAGGKIRVPRPRRPDSRREKHREILQLLYEDHGYTLRRLAERTGNSETTALRDLAAMGVARRPAAHLWWELDRPRALKAALRGT